MSGITRAGKLAMVEAMGWRYALFAVEFVPGHWANHAYVMPHDQRVPVTPWVELTDGRARFETDRDLPRVVIGAFDGERAAVWTDERSARAGDRVELDAATIVLDLDQEFWA